MCRFEKANIYHIILIFSQANTCREAYALKGQSHENVGELSVWGVNLCSN
jgi:hypothetical protein